MSDKTKIIKLVKKQGKGPGKGWAQFKAGYKGQGAHRDKSKYTRKQKHKQDLGDSQ
jgi:hypothetical protein